MSLPACFAAPDASVGAIPMVLVSRDSLAATVERQPPRVKNWVAASGYLGDPGSVLLVPAENGSALLALIGVVVNDALPLSAVPLQLPAGTYRLHESEGLRVDQGSALLSWGLGAYQYSRYKKVSRDPARLVLLDDAKAQSEAFALLKATTLCRDLVNTPTEDMGPDELEAACRRVAHAYAAKSSVVSGDELLKQNFPAIHAVGRASHRAPRLIEINWGKDEHPRVAIVGKGVCFDTGGLDLKTADGMRHMKKDMGGAAHAIALAQLVMARKLPVRLQMLIPAVENAIAANAYRPGEVLKTRAGISVEIDNTDAEGRIVLCDALAYAAESKPTVMIDFATLTGAARVALGPDLPALFVNDEALASEFLAAAARCGDPVWRMPLWRPYLSMLTSNVADIANSGGSKMAGCITAALYLERFVPSQLPWAHLDTYAWSEGGRPGRPVGGEALGLRAAYQTLKARFPK